jgi:manganese/zinc/iron transport system permease protein
MQEAMGTFFSLADPNIRYVVLGTLLCSATTAMVGVFALLKHKALVGDAVAHATLPGICLSFLITGTKHPFTLALGAFTTGWLAMLLIDTITHRSKVQEDTAIALVLSFTFGVGMLLLTAIQHTGNAAQVGLSNFLFGKTAALVSADLRILTSLSLVLLVVLALFFKEFSLIAFNKLFAQSSGLPVQRLELLLTSLMVLAIVVGIRVVGILLITSMLITPPAAARFWTHHLPTMIGLSAIFGMVAGLFGVFISYVTPSMPTGPWIVIIISLMAYGSFLFAPRKGLLARSIQQRRHRQKTLTENILKRFYELGTVDGHFYKGRTLDALHQHRPLATSRKLLWGLLYLQRQKMLQKKEGRWRLTTKGKRKGEEISELHCLWELYLTKYLKLNPNHVHEDAESIEHVITPALASELRDLVRLSPAKKK